MKFERSPRLVSASPPAAEPPLQSTRPRLRLRRHALYLCLLCVGPLACKSAHEYALAADEEAYALVRDRRALIFEERDAFTIEPPADSLRERILAGEVTELRDLGLVECLEIAAENHRDYQRRKEDLYLAALDLTLERWQLGLIPTLTADGTVTGFGSEAESTNGGTDLGLSKVLGTGAQVVGGIGIDVFKGFLTGGDWDFSTSASLLFTQPLLAGAGSIVVYEDLRQSERDLVYEVRSFERFRRELSVDIAARLLRILQQANTVENEEANYQRLRQIRTRNEALSEAGRLSPVQVDQASQNEYTSETRLIDARQTYQGLLDELKFFLGLPPSVTLSLREDELERLAARGMEHEDVDWEEAVETALDQRPDFWTAVDRAVDGERKSRVAAEALRVGLDLVSTLDISSDPRRPARFNFKDVQWSIGLALDLPVNRLPQRNIYRTALITWQRRARDAQALKDQITLDLRNELRDLRARRASYRIQERAVDLAERRVESVQLSQQAGRASTRDLLESQSALVSSQNARTRALIDYTLARLRLILDMGLLRVEETGIEVVDTDVQPPGAPQPTHPRKSQELES